MASVNRVPHNLVPQQWAFDPEIGPFIRDIMDVLLQLRNRTGGDDDEVSNQSTRELFPWTIGEDNNVQYNFTSQNTDNIMGWL
jgi:hypothetical protein